MKKMRSYFVFIFALFAGCSADPLIIEAPQEVRETAWQEAERYLGMDYEWGGQDFPRNLLCRRGVDCSGLVVNCYLAAVEQTQYALLFDDATVAAMMESYTVEPERPEKGDLIFMGEGDVGHVALYEKTEAGQVWFIDAYSATGYVEYRSYKTDNPKIRWYGRMLLAR